MTNEKRWMAETLSQSLKLVTAYIGRHGTTLRPKGTLLSSVESWLAGFVNAGFVITDSFHGMVFSILFNKPFCVIDNASRGSARFTSLLSKFGLQDRIVASIEDIEKLRPIDWATVNAIREQEARNAINCLHEQLIG